MSAHAVRHAPYQAGKYAPAHHSIIQNLWLLTHAELMLALIAARRTEQEPVGTIPDDLWEKWTRKSARTKEYAEAGFREKGLVRVEGRGDEAQYSLDLRSWNRYCASADKHEARTQGRAIAPSSPKPEKSTFPELEADAHPECIARGCALTRQNIRAGLVAEVPAFATEVNAFAQPVARTLHDKAGQTQAEALHEAPGREAARKSVEAAAITGPDGGASPSASAGKLQPSDANSGPASANTGDETERAWPVTMASMREFFVTAGGVLLQRILAIVLALFPDLTDIELATAVMHGTNPRNQASAGLWLHTLPRVVKSLREQRAKGAVVSDYGDHRGVARPGPDWTSNPPRAAAYEPEPEDSRSAWADIRRFLRSRISEQGYQNWVALTASMGIVAGEAGRELQVRVPDAITREWIEAEYMEDIRLAIGELGIEIDAVVFVHVAAREVEA